jgi:hypothetical protein
MNRPISKADLLGILLALLLLVPVLAQVPAVAKEADNRKKCAANLRGIMQSLSVYAADNADAYPVLPPKVSTTYDVTLKDDPGDKDASKAIRTLFTDKKYADNPMANLWLLVLTGQVAPRQFLCPSDTFATKAATPTKGDLYYYNFCESNNVSYSSAYPWDGNDGRGRVAGLWRNQSDPTLPLMSDMAPYLGEKAKLGEPATRPAGSKETEPVDPEWAVKKANSQNHAFEGQNIGYGDAHVDWASHPNMGQNGNSIWGIREKPDDDGVREIPIEAGTLPHAIGGSQDNYDIVMVPTRDSKGNLK